MSVPSAAPELRPWPGSHDGSSGQVVAQRLFRWGFICHHARLAFGSIVNLVAARCAPTLRAATRPIATGSRPRTRARRGDFIGPGTGRSASLASNAHLVGVTYAGANGRKGLTGLTGRNNGHAC